LALHHADAQTKGVEAIHTIDDDPEAAPRALSEIVRLAKVK
jgi:hypothetical protein